MSFVHAVVITYLLKYMSAQLQKRKTKTWTKLRSNKLLSHYKGKQTSMQGLQGHSVGKHESEQKFKVVVRC